MDRHLGHLRGGTVSPQLLLRLSPAPRLRRQKDGPDSPAALKAVRELDEQIGQFVDGFAGAYSGSKPLWLVASEYVITPVDHVSYPNRVLREAGLLTVKLENGREHFDLVAEHGLGTRRSPVLPCVRPRRSQRFVARVCELFQHNQASPRSCPTMSWPTTT